MASPYRAIIENMFSVVDRHRNTVPFVLTETQARLDEEWDRRIVVTKIRQHAMISSYVIARFTAKCLAEENQNCVLISHEAEATARLLARARFMINNLRNVDVPPKITTDRTNALVFGNTGSSFWIGTAGQRTFGRGDTISALHLSEAAFYEDPERLRDGIFPAAEYGDICVESTGNGRGNWFHRLAQDARRGLGFKLIFFPWTGLASCSLPLTLEQHSSMAAHLREDWDEPGLYASGVTLQQLAWRRERIQGDYEGNLARFKENYPAHFEECFRPAGLSFFPKTLYLETDRWIEVSLGYWRLADHPAPGHRYVGGVDVAGGVEQDDSVLCIFDLDSQEQVAEYATATRAPDEFAHDVARIGKEFNNAYLNIERNNHGLTTLSTMLSHYPIDRLHRGTASSPASQVALTHLSNYGTYISETTRGLLLGTGRAMLSSWRIHSPLLRDQLSTFIEAKSGKFEASAGSHDDRVFAACHALFVIEKASIYTMDAPKPTPAQQAGWVELEDGTFGLTFESVFPDIDKPGSKYGISERFG